jgi:hypothetical protein
MPSKSGRTSSLENCSNANFLLFSRVVAVPITSAMSAVWRLQTSSRLLQPLEISKTIHRAPFSFIFAPVVRSGRRYASSTPDPNKPIVLEQPDKFRPPSHAARLVKGRPRGSTLGGAYNQGSTTREREEQKTRSYPHMFPEKGTFMHAFLTTPVYHLLITLVSRLLAVANMWCETKQLTVF